MHLNQPIDMSACPKGSTLYGGRVGQMRVTKAFVQGCPQIKNALAELADNPNEVPKVRSESNGLYERMCQLETGIDSVFWNDIGLLERVNATSRKLHDLELDLNAAVAMVVSQKMFVEAKLT